MSFFIFLSSCKSSVSTSFFFSFLFLSCASCEVALFFTEPMPGLLLPSEVTFLLTEPKPFRPPVLPFFLSFFVFFPRDSCACIDAVWSFPSSLILTAACICFAALSSLFFLRCSDQAACILLAAWSCSVAALPEGVFLIFSCFLCLLDSFVPRRSFSCLATADRLFLEFVLATVFLSSFSCFSFFLDSFMVATSVSLLASNSASCLAVMSTSLPLCLSSLEWAVASPGLDCVSSWSKSFSSSNLTVLFLA
jgi:hypothetical protein